MLAALATLFLLASTVPQTLAEKVHEKLSVDEIASFFKTTPDAVPEYEVVQFHVPRVAKRSADSIESLVAKVFGLDIDLWLRPVEGVLAGQSTPVYKATFDWKTGEVIYNEVPDAMKTVGKLLEDPVKKATLVLRTDSKGRHSFTGFIESENLVVKPFPDSFSERFEKNSTYDRDEEKSAYHFVYKKKPIDMSKLAVTELETRTNADPSSHNNIPDVVYPELMVVLDHTLYSLYNQNLDDVLMYVLAFWNGVDLLYRSLEEPKFRFNIARVVVSTDRRSTPFFVNHMYDSDIIDAYPALIAAEKYYFSILNVFPVYSYDSAIIMTSHGMTSGKGERDVLGIARNSGACLIDYHNKMVNSLSLVTDDGTFHGVATAAHEFAHLLGSSHDEDVFCKSTDGFIMAPNSGVTENAHDFSECSIAAIDRFLRHNYGYCFYNVPKVTKPLPRGFLPALMSDRDHQCYMLTKGKSCFTGSAHQKFPCSAVYCTDPSDQGQCYRYRSQAPPDGAVCAPGKICLHGTCVKV